MSLMGPYSEPLGPQLLVWSDRGMTLRQTLGVIRSERSLHTQHPLREYLSVNCGSCKLMFGSRLPLGGTELLTMSESLTYVHC